MNEAHVFQHKTTGVQIFVYRKNSIEEANKELVGLVFYPENWIYLCKKVAIEVK